MPGLDPGIHVFAARQDKKDVDGRVKASGSDAVFQTAMPGHDGTRPGCAFIFRNISPWQQGSLPLACALAGDGGTQRHTET
jgi:hypothetical protein